MEKISEVAGKIKYELLDSSMIDGRRVKGDKRLVFDGLRQPLKLRTNTFKVFFKEPVWIMQISITYAKKSSSFEFTGITHRRKSQKELKSNTSSTDLTEFVDINDLVSQATLTFKSPNPEILSIKVLYYPIEITEPFYSKLTNLYTELNSTNKKIEDFNQQLADKESELHKINNDLDEAEDELRAKKEMVEKARAELSENAAELKHVKQNLADDQTTTREMKTEQAKLEQSNQEITKAIRKSESKLRSLEASIDQYPDTLEGFRTESSNNISKHNSYILFSLVVMIIVSLTLIISSFKIILNDATSISHGLAQLLSRAPLGAIFIFILYSLKSFIERSLSEIERYSKEMTRLTQLSVLAKEAHESVLSQAYGEEKVKLTASDKYKLKINAKLHLIMEHLLDMRAKERSAALKVKNTDEKKESN